MGKWLPIALLFAFPPAVRSESWLGAGAELAGDDYGYRWDEYRVGFRHETDSAGARLVLRFHTYSLEEERRGVLPFDGSEPAAELGGHLLLDQVWWLGLAAGVQGGADLDSAVGEFVAARAFSTEAGTFTPRIELAREPLAHHALPLSLGLISHRAEGLLAWRATGVTAEAGVRADFWESDVVPGRVRNPALDAIPSTRVTTVHGYALTDGEDHWFDAGLAAKGAWSSRNTQLATRLVPVPAYSWYPASAPPQLWETALVLRAHGQLLESLAASLQLNLPALSQETRQWESLQQTDWGTAPFEAQLDVRWLVFASTALSLGGLLFLKPWRNWDAFGPDAYKMASLTLSIEQRI